MPIGRQILLFTAISLSFLAQSQDAKTNSTLLRENKKENRFSIGFGGNLSSINLSRNYRENPYKIGLNARATYDANGAIRVMAEYCYTPKFDLDPTWLNIHNQVFGLSANVMAYTRTRQTMIYTITGVGIQRWKGFYTGIHDFSRAKFYHQPNTTVLNKTLGLDLGIGFEKEILGSFLYFDFRYRFAQLEHAFGITDVIYNLGLKFPIRGEDLKKKDKKGRAKGRHHRKSDRYHWF
jgi:hypothetical protein